MVGPPAPGARVPPGSGPGAPVGVTATSGTPPSGSHVSMNSQVSCSEETDNQPIRVLSPRFVGDGVYPNFLRSEGPS